MAKKRIGVWIDEENIAALDMLAAMITRSRSRVINTLTESLDRISEELKKGNDDWRNKEWD